MAVAALQALLLDMNLEKKLRNESPVYPGNAQLPSLVQVVALLVSKWRVGSPGNDAELLVLIVDPLFDTVR
jgi:hypothetical protein